MPTELDRCLILCCACSDHLLCFGCIPVTECLLILYISWTLAWKCCKYGRLSPPPRVGPGPTMNVCHMWVGKLRRLEIAHAIV
jgi:hypothetical protein